eukprot:GHVL01025737.1.p1 GENE.GHVL01025737.1~~GHVL01025737.1.p1  ORF type:complete len:613 (+),score=238.26 GHVL01025737.1:29-1867(+)
MNLQLILLDKSSILNKLWIASTYESKLKKNDFDMKLSVAVKMILDKHLDLPLRFAGSFLSGATKIYSKKTRQFEYEVDRLLDSIRDAHKSKQCELGLSEKNHLNDILDTHVECFRFNINTHVKNRYGGDITLSDTHINSDLGDFLESAFGPDEDINTPLYINNIQTPNKSISNNIQTPIEFTRAVKENKHIFGGDLNNDNILNNNIEMAKDFDLDAAISGTPQKYENIYNDNENDIYNDSIIEPDTPKGLRSPILDMMTPDIDISHNDISDNNISEKLQTPVYNKLAFINDDIMDDYNDYVIQEYDGVNKKNIRGNNIYNNINRENNINRDYHIDIIPELTDKELNIKYIYDDDEEDDIENNILNIYDKSLYIGNILNYILKKKNILDNVNKNENNMDQDNDREELVNNYELSSELVFDGVEDMDTDTDINISQNINIENINENIENVNENIENVNENIENVNENINENIENVNENIENVNKNIENVNEIINKNIENDKDDLIEESAAEYSIIKLQENLTDKSFKTLSYLRSSCAHEAGCPLSEYMKTNKTLPVLSLKGLYEMEETKSRRAVAEFFGELLLLKTRGLINIQQNADEEGKDVKILAMGRFFLE